jgi:hypothetical protein
MYSRREISQTKEAFWTAFGRYMVPVSSAEGEHINWINYKTGIAGVQFKMDADGSNAIIALSFVHKNVEQQHRFYDKLLELRAIFEARAGNDWDWQAVQHDSSGKIFSGVAKTLSGYKVLNQQDWPELITFFKQNIISLDEFWSVAKYGFEELL